MSRLTINIHQADINSQASADKLFSLFLEWMYSAEVSVFDGHLHAIGVMLSADSGYEPVI